MSFWLDHPALRRCALFVVAALCGNTAHAQQTETLYFSTLGNNASVPGVAAPYDSSDIYAHDETGYRRALDAVSDLKLPSGVNVDAFHWADDSTFYVSLVNTTATVSGLGTVRDEQVLKYENGTWSLFFDGAACGLDADDNGDVDAISVAGNVLYFSTVGDAAVSGLGAPDDADVYAWVQGDGSCSRVFDASSLGLAANADIDGLEVHGSVYYLSFNRDAGTNVPGGIGLVQDEAVVSLDTATSAWSLYFSGPGLGSSIFQDVDAISVQFPLVDPPAPTLSILAPVEGASVVGPTVTVTWSSAGDVAQASGAVFQLDGGPEMAVTQVQGDFSIDGVGAGAHVLDGFLTRADGSRIAGSEAIPVSFTVTSPPAPRLVIDAPAPGAILTGSSVQVSFHSTGDLAEADHAHFRLDGGPDMMVMSLSGQFQIDGVSPGSHLLDGYLVRADHSPIVGSDAVAVGFSVDATPAVPKLSITAPTEGAIVVGSTIDVSFTSSGDLSQADHVHLHLDGGPELMVMALDGQAQITGVAPGPHFIDGYIVRADHSRIVGSDAPRINFSTSIPAPNDPLVVGQWSSQAINLPTVAVNLVLLHSGKLIFWAGDFETAPNYGELWDPITNLISPVPNPYSNIFCSAHVALSDGRLLVAGGHDAQNGIMGIADSNVFDPVSEAWTPLPDMAYRRWYPTLTALSDGRAIVTSGSENSESVFVEIPEIYDPVANTWTRLLDARLSVPQYPMMFLLPDGRLLQAGSTEQPTPTRALDIGSQTWSVVDSRVLEGGSGVMYRPGRIMKSGSSSNDGATPTATSDATTYVIDMNAPAPAWRSTAPMQFARTFHNLTSLPDGTVLVTSGSTRKSETNLAPAVLEAELWNPDTETWKTLAPMSTPRIYHSTAVLLPDARVAISGSGNIAGGTDQKNLEIYSPPYLFKGPRPVLTSAPSRIEYGSTFSVQTPDAASITAVNLLRLGAATHNFDQEQRFVPLSFTRTDGALQVQATANANVAPPGYYMLFLVNGNGVPSVSKFVRFPAPYEDAVPPSAPGSVTGSGSVGSATLSWTAATDAGGIDGYEVHRSTTAGFVPSGATLIARVTGTTYSDLGLSAGTYYYVVIAVDRAGNAGPASGQVTVLVTADTQSPLVAVTTPAADATVTGTVTVAASASDNVGVAGVQFRLDGAALGAEDLIAPYSLTWNTTAATNAAHTLTAVARDGSGNTTESVAVRVVVSNSAQAPAGLVAAYGFEEGTGTTVADSSGNGNGGTLAGPTWSAEGRFGKALSFDGVDDLVTIPDAASLDLTSGLTLAAWVYPTALSGWRTVLLKEVPSEISYALYAHDDAPRPAGYVRTGGGSTAVPGAGALPLATWTHLALTYDGATLRLYQNGAQVGSRAVTGAITTSSLPLRIGGNSVWGEYFSGRIDEVKVYNRALTPTEIQSDLNGPLPTAPRLAITAPLDGATISGTQVNVSYAASGDTSEAARVRLQLDGGPDIELVPLSGSVQLTGVSAGAHVLTGYLARADGSKIDGSDAASVGFDATVPDTASPAVVLVTPRDGDPVTGTVSVTASASDDVGVAGVQFRLDGAALGAEDLTAPYALTWNTTTATNGAHVLTAVARDAAGNTAQSIAVRVIVSNTVPAPSGLVAAYGFEEGTGATAADTSGNGNGGTLAGPTWTAEGRFGKALSFDGVDDLVSIADAASLDLTSGLTLAAWVHPTALSGWRTALLKAVPGEISYALYAHDDAPRPAGYVRIGSSSTAVPGAGALPLNAWTHLALTYDGATLRLYQNGVQVGSRALTGAITTSSLPLQIGGNSVWGEYFSGRIDEVKVYNRALTPAELQSDLNVPADPRLTQPTRSTPIAIDPAARRVWVVNPDSDSVTAFAADSLAVQVEVPVGTHPTSLALDGAGQLWVTCRDDDSVWVLDAATGATRRVLATGRGTSPVAVVFDPLGANGYIALEGTGRVHRVAQTATQLGASVDVGPTPRALAITGDGSRLLVSQFVSTEGVGRVRSVALAGLTAGPTIPLPLDTTSIDGSLAARGLPNYLAGIAIHPASGQAWVVGKKDNVVRGSLRDGQPLTFETTVRALVARIDLALDQERTNERVDLDNQSQPSAVALGPSGEQAFVTVQGTNQLIVLNQLGGEIARASTGLAPQGVAIDPTTKRVFTQDFMGRTVSVFDATQVLSQGSGPLPRIAQVQTTTNEKLSPAVLLGKRIFYNAEDPRMSRDGYISCASCHLDGGHDGQVWDFTDRGEGLRNTISLRGQGGNAGAPLHWTGNFDEVQDFENDIRSFFGGSGFMNGVDFATGTRSQPLGDPKAGISAELDALASYVDSLDDAGRSPFRLADGSLSASAQAGQAIFQQLGCQSCHSGARFSDSPTGARHDVGTIKASSGQRAGGVLDGLDTPTLLGLPASAPYLHDGSASTLLEVLTTANSAGQHGDTSGLSPGELNQLVDYLLQLESQAP